MSKHHSSSIGYSILLLASVLYGTYGVWSHLMGDSFGPFYQAWVRSLLIMAIMTPFMLRTRSFKKIARRDWRPLGIFIAFCVCTQAPLYYAFNNAPIGTVQLAFYSMFVIAAYLVGRLYLGETITRVKLASMILAFVGLAFVFGHAVIAFAPLGLLLAMFNGFASGAETTSTKLLSDKYPPALIVFWGWVFTFALHLPVSLIIGEEQVAVQFNQAWLWLVVYPFVNAAAFWLPVHGFRHVDASIGSLVGLSEVIFGVVFGAIIFDEVLSWGIYLGGVLIICAAMLPDVLNIIHHKRTKQPVEPVRVT
jgi:drug/metabolite transporter (DMT)-like permease